ncbi:MAG TPA: type II secretion system F family protein [Acidimicrobiales bacterium]|nr:type II secretion system F family protein [Acidimicrobiales bacterium]
MTGALVVLWMAFVATGAVVLRPVPAQARARALRPDHATATNQPRPASAGVLVRLGTVVIGAARAATVRPRATPVDPARARRVGAAVIAGLIPVALLPVAAVPAAAIAFYVPAVAERRRRIRAQHAVDNDLPEAVDLLVLAIGGGLSVRQALEAVAHRGSGPLAAHLRAVVADVGRGRRLADALDDLPARAGEGVRPLVGALTSAERYGAPLNAALDRLADEVRAIRRRRAEEAARRVPVKLLFPLVACILPAFALLTVAPLIAGALKTLRLP